MALTSIHLNQASHNYSLLKDLKSKYKDWKIIVAYYTAIHIFDSKLEKHYPILKAQYMERTGKTSIPEHKIRWLAIKGNDKDLLNDFELLEQRSKEARYLKDIDKESYLYFREEDVIECVNVKLKNILSYYKISF